MKLCCGINVMASFSFVILVNIFLKNEMTQISNPAGTFF